jgi:hypothetical protein
MYLSVELAGTLDSAERKLLASAPFSFVRHLGALPLKRAQQLQHDADVLLVFDTPLQSEESVFFPSKLLDYLVAGHPIFALTSLGSMTRDIVTGSVGRCFEHTEIEAAGSHLLELIAQHRQGGGRRADRDGRALPPDRFSASVNAARLVKLMQELR